MRRSAPTCSLVLLIALIVLHRAAHVQIMEQGAALPWGAAAHQQQEEEVPVVPDLPTSTGLGLGSRVEVLWEVTDEDGEQEPCKKVGLRVSACALGGNASRWCSLHGCE